MALVNERSDRLTTVGRRDGAAYRLVMSVVYYFIPVVVIVGMLAYVFFYRAKMQQAIAQGHGPMMFHNTFAGWFRSFAPDEHIVALWQGVAYTGSASRAAQIGGAVLNEITSKAVGYSRYTPQVMAALSSHGRLLVIEEFSEMGQRGNFREVVVWGPGATAVAGAGAVPDHSGPPPENPFNRAVTLELVRLVGPDGSAYPCWLSPQSLEVTGAQRSVAAVLPVSPEQARATWDGAVARAQPRAA